MPKNVKNTTSPGLFDLIAPHSCRGCGRIGNIICERCKKYILESHQNLCPYCKTPNLNGICHDCQTHSPIYIIGKRDELIGDLVQAFKYQSIRSLAPVLAELLHNVLPLIEGKIIVIPLPTIARHVRKRGLDHTYLIAKKFCRLRGTNYQTKRLLIRANNTVQVGANKATRKAQAKHAYQINPRIPTKKNATYLLLDDVWTTGASLNSAASILKKNGLNQIMMAALALSE